MSPKGKFVCERLAVPCLVLYLSVFYGSQKLFMVLNNIQKIRPYTKETEPSSGILSFYNSVLTCSLGLAIGLFPLGFSTKFLEAYLTFQHFVVLYSESKSDFW
jgi:hypothetical protein